MNDGRPMVEFLSALIRFYQRRLSPRWGGSCRFEPSCSTYALAAIERHGVVTGLRLIACRLARCRPGRPAGEDPVPPPDRVADACLGRLIREGSPQPDAFPSGLPHRRVVYSKADLARRRK